MMEDLGAGFYLAMHDLEIRGAGEVLGESQSGGIHDIGFTLYTEMLDHAVRSLKAGREPDLAQPLAVATEINLHSPALLPEDYCGDVHERLVLYKRLANCASAAEIDGMVEELVDRFGMPPETTRVLVESHRLRILGEPLGVAKIDASPAGIVVQFVPRPPIEPQRIIALVQASRLYRLVGPERIRIEVKCEALAQRVAEVKSLFKRLSGDASGKKPASAAA
jgi:transcription-repair coupling factor (superfamily II helicase)